MSRVGVLTYPERGRNRVKHLKLFVATAAVALVGVFSPGVAGAQPAPAELNIEPQAQLVTLTTIDVAFRARCTGSGLVFMNVTQGPPDNTFPVSGDGITGVVCDGRWHEGAVTVGGFFFDLGRAHAVGTLSSTSGTDTDARDINITF
jgi:hypothetical protein